MADQIASGEEMALDLILRNPNQFGRSVILDQIELRKRRLSQFSDHVRVAAIQDELARLQAALPAE